MSTQTQSLGKHGLENLDLLQNAGLAGAALGRAHLNALLVVEHLGNILLEAGIDALKLLIRKLVHGDTGLLREGNAATRDVVSLAEWNTLADKVVSKVSGEHEGVKGLLHLLGLNAEGSQNTVGDLDAVGNSLDVVEHGLPGLLEILVVSAGNALLGHHEASHVTKGTASLAPEQLETVGVLLLGHKRAAGRVGIRQPNETELASRVDDEILGPARDVLHQHSAPLEGLGNEVTVGNSAHGVPEEAIEAKLLGHHLTIDAEGVTGKGTATKSAAVDALDNLTEALEIASESKAVRHHPVAPTDRLGALQMGVAGHDDIDLLLGAGSSNAEEVLEVLLDLAELVAEPHAHIGSDLLVTGATGVKLASNILSDDLAEATLVGSVDILVDAGDDLEGTLLPLLLDSEETLLQLAELVLGDDAGLGVGAGKGNAAGDVLGVEGTVEVDGLVVLDHEGVEAACEQRLAYALSLQCVRLTQLGPKQLDGAAAEYDQERKMGEKKASYRGVPVKRPPQSMFSVGLACPLMVARLWTKSELSIGMRSVDTSFL